MSEPVSPPYKLPPEVLRLLGDDATPEVAAEKLEASRDRNLERVRKEWTPYEGFAGKAWWMAIAAAAIRECEARRAWDAYVSSRHMSRDDGVAAQRACKETGDAYDALRNWRKA